MYIYINIYIYPALEPQVMGAAKNSEKSTLQQV